MSGVLIIIGSVTPPGRLSRAAEAAAMAVSELAPEVRARTINLADVRIAFADGRPPEQLGDDTAAVVGAIAEADAVLFASPVYRASMTGALKNLLDHVPVESLWGKPCGIIAMGATPHHFLGVDSHLRDVLAWFGALVAPVSVYLTSADFVEGALGDRAGQDLRALVASVLRLRAAALHLPAPLGPAPLAAQRRG